MKKILFSLAIIAMVSFMATSCKKNCKCTGKVLGTDWSLTYTAEQLDALNLTCDNLKSLHADVENFSCK